MATQDEVVLYPQSPIDTWEPQPQPPPQSQSQSYNRERDRDREADQYDREREAFGIPRSLSFDADASPIEEGSDYEREVEPGFERRAPAPAPTIRVESASGASVRGSGAGAGRKGALGLSEGAEALFDHINTGGSRGRARDVDPRSGRTPAKFRGQSYSGDRERERESRDARRRSYSQDSVAVSMTIPPSVSDDRSIYDNTTTTTNTNPNRASFVSAEAIRPPSPKGPSWRSTLQPSTFSTLLAHYGAREMERQEVIFSLFVSEQAQIKRLRTIVRQFILPLRSRDSTSWLPGVPEEVGKLFDWLEDVVNLQVDIVRALKVLTNVWQAGAIVERVAETLRTFVHRLEVYQPYLGRVDEVRQLVAMCVREGNEFGQYVKLRQRERDSDGWTLQALLEEPVKRITSYPEFYTVRVLAQIHSR